MFDTYIGIDWSGAQGEFHRGIQVAVAKAGSGKVELSEPPGQDKRWSREAVMEHLLEHAGRERVLAGIDFAFAHPYPYYPEAAGSPADAASLWQCLDDANSGQDHLYGGGVWAHRIYGEYYNRPGTRGGKGRRFESSRRRTEKAAAEIRHPSPTFNCVGPASVGTGSLAGMRLLNRLNGDRGAGVAIWPFHESGPETRLTVVEIFPTLYFAMAGVKDAERRNDPQKALDRGLEFFCSDPVDRPGGSFPDNDDLDAMVSAAALRHIVEVEKGLPQIPPNGFPRAKMEGWIFGAGWDGEPG